MLQYFIENIFDLSKEEDNIIYSELLYNKRIYDILSKHESPISSEDYDKCLELIDKIRDILYEKEND